MTVTDGVRESGLGPVWIYLLALALFFLRFGYGFGLGDQDEVLPYLLHILDPTLLQNDWFVQLQSTSFSVRTYFVYALLPLSKVMPIEAAVLGMYLLLWLVIALAAYRLARIFGTGQPAAAATVILSLGILHKWTLGSNDLVYSMLVPEMAAWALALPAIRAHVQQRHMLSALLLGVSAWFQVLVGILVFGALLAEQLARPLFRGSKNDVDWKSVFFGLGTFLLASAPASIPVVLQQLRSLGTDGADPLSVFYILAPFRNPVHHMISAFPSKAIIRFAVMSVLAAAGLRMLHRSGSIQHAGFLARFGMIILSGCAVMAVFTEVVPVLFVAKLQIYKLTVVFKLLALAVILQAAFQFLPETLLTRARTALVSARVRAAGVVLVLTAAGLVYLAAPGPVSSRLMATVHRTSDLGRMEAWISANLPRSAVFAVPPSNSSFRFNAGRAIVVNFMAFPYDDVEMVEWFRRIQDVAPIQTPESGLGIRPILDRAFEQHSAAHLGSLADTYGIDYVLRRTQLDHLASVKTIGEWHVYRLR